MSRHGLEDASLIATKESRQQAMIDHEQWVKKFNLDVENTCRMMSVITNNIISGKEQALDMVAPTDDKENSGIMAPNQVPGGLSSSAIHNLTPIKCVSSNSTIDIQTPPRKAGRQLYETIPETADTGSEQGGLSFDTQQPSSPATPVRPATGTPSSRFAPPTPYPRTNRRLPSPAPPRRPPGSEGNEGQTVDEDASFVSEQPSALLEPPKEVKAEPVAGLLPPTIPANVAKILAEKALGLVSPSKTVTITTTVPPTQRAASPAIVVEEHVYRPVVTQGEYYVPAGSPRRYPTTAHGTHGAYQTAYGGPSPSRAQLVAQIAAARGVSPRAVSPLRHGPRTPLMMQPSPSPPPAAMSPFAGTMGSPFNLLPFIPTEAAPMEDDRRGHKHLHTHQGTDVFFHGTEYYPVATRVHAQRVDPRSYRRYPESNHHGSHGHSGGNHGHGGGYSGHNARSRKHGDGHRAQKRGARVASSATDYGYVHPAAAMLGQGLMPHPLQLAAAGGDIRSFSNVMGLMMGGVSGSGWSTSAKWK